MKILVLDNYDSFTYNLVQLLQSFKGVHVSVRRNDMIELAEVAEYSRIVLSPGPGIPSESGIMPELVKCYAPTRKILGICLGHQCIGEVFGGTLKNLAVPVHGKTTTANVVDPEDPLFKGLPSSILVGRYHSWVVDRANFPSTLVETATASDGEIMALRHKEYDVRGVQFHPESILTSCGPSIIANWLAE